MNDFASANPQEPTPPTPPPTSLGARMVNVFATPSDVFDEVKASPAQTANWLVPALLALLVGWIRSWLVLNQEAIKQQFADMQEKQYQKMIDKGRMTREQLEAQRPMMEKVGNISRQVGMFVAPPLTAFGFILWWGLITFLVGNYALGGKFSYLKAVEVSGLIGVLAILESVIKTLLMLTFGSLFAGPNLAMLLVKEFDPANLTHGLLAAVDIVALWVLVVRSIGLARLSGASLGKCVAWVFGLWLLWTGLWIVLGYYLQRAFGGG
jgi:hypothetical protein